MPRSAQSACVFLALVLCAACAAPQAAPQKPDESSEKAASEQPKVQIGIGPEGVSLHAVSVDAHEVLTTLARRTGFRVIVDDTVRRSVTVHFVNRKASEILNAIVAAYGLSCKEVNGIFMVSEGIPRSPSSYLLSDIDAISTQYVLAPNAKSLLPVFLQDHVKTNQEQNAVILSAPTDVLRKFREDIKQFDIPASQILLEVLMVEFTDTGAREFGLRWDWSNATRQVAVDAPTGSIFYHTLVTLPNTFGAELKALVTSGKARIKASPRIATVSGQRASVFIGKQRYLSTPVAIPRSDDEYGGVRQSNAIDAGVRLTMTPWTGGQGEIIVDVRPEISVLSAPDANTGLPDRSTRRANTTVRVRDGETVIIGGLMQEESRRTRTKVPLLGDLPILGPLFRSTNDQQSTTELAIFVTPRILSQTGRLPAEEEKKYENLLKEARPTDKGN
jgi:type IV pilus assembly protein PilQ